LKDEIEVSGSRIFTFKEKQRKYEDEMRKSAIITSKKAHEEEVATDMVKITEIDSRRLHEGNEIGAI
jgi:hypothetical protein